MKCLRWPLLSAFLLGLAAALPVTFVPVAQARAGLPPAAPVPQPRAAQYPAGTLPLAGLSLSTRGQAPELGWAARDLKAEWQTRLGLDLPLSPAGRIVIGTVADPALAARIKAAGLSVTGGEEAYALLVDGSGAYVVGASARGAYEGAQTLRQLLTPAGLR